MIKIVRLENFNRRALAEVNHLVSQMGLTNVPPKKLTHRTFTELLSQKSVYFLTAKPGSKKEDKILGIITLYLVRIPTGLIALTEDLIVDLPYRSWGVGRLLVEESVRIARENHARHISLRTNPKRLDANKLCQALGFAKMETNFYRINLFK